MSNSPRQFTDSVAVRKKVPLWIGLSGLSGGGKTYSAFRLATGMQRVHGGDIYGIDTESNRMLHYADKFKFRHIPFSAPFGSLDYLQAVQYATGRGGSIIIVDSMSHEHVGEGGCLEAHEAEVTRLCKGDDSKRGKMQFPGWAKPKANRTRMINALLQMNACFIFCFRAKEKQKPKGGGELQNLGIMPLAGEELVFEMTANALLLPGAGGVPIWKGEEIGEKMMIKLPEQFRNYFLQDNTDRPLDEAAGEFMARWALGDVSTPEEKTNQEAFDLLIQEAYGVTTLEGIEEIRKKASKNKGVMKSKIDEMKEIITKKTAELAPVREPGEDS